MDPEFLGHMQKEYNLKYSFDNRTGKKMTTPLIFGTPIKEEKYDVKLKNPSKNMRFNRKLRMIRADIFTLLSISINSGFFKEPMDAAIIKKACIKFLEGEFNDRDEDY